MAIYTFLKTLLIFFLIYAILPKYVMATDIRSVSRKYPNTIEAKIIEKKKEKTIEKEPVPEKKNSWQRVRKTTSYKAEDALEPKPLAPAEHIEIDPEDYPELIDTIAYPELLLHTHASKAPIEQENIFVPIIERPNTTPSMEYSSPTSTLPIKDSNTNINKVLEEIYTPPGNTDSPTQQIPPVEKKSPPIMHVNDYVNLSTFQVYISLRGGAVVGGSYHSFSNSNDNYISAGITPFMGTSIGIAIQPIAQFAIRLGVGIEYIFPTKHSHFSLSSNTTGTTIPDKKHSFEQMNILGELYCDFRSGMWSAFFIKIAGGYSSAYINGTANHGAVVGAGIGFRWYPHKYMSIDWTMIDAQTSFAKIPTLHGGTTLGVTFQY